MQQCSYFHRVNNHLLKSFVNYQIWRTHHFICIVYDCSLLHSVFWVFCKSVFASVYLYADSNLHRFSFHQRIIKNLNRRLIDVISWPVMGVLLIERTQSHPSWIGNKTDIFSQRLKAPFWLFISQRFLVIQQVHVLIVSTYTYYLFCSQFKAHSAKNVFKF